MSCGKFIVLIFFLLSILFQPLFSIGSLGGENASHFSRLPLLSSDGWHAGQMILYPSLLPFTNTRTAGVGYYSPYSIPDFHYVYGFLVLPAKKFFPFSLQVSQLGNDLYSESQYSLGSGIGLSERFSVGMRIAAYQQHVERYSDQFLASLQLDGLFLFGKQPRAFVHILAGNLIEAGDRDEQDLPMFLSLHYSFQIFSDAGAGVGSRFTQYRESEYIFNGWKVFLNRIHIVYSHYFPSGQFAFGVQYRLNSFLLGYVFHYHPDLDQTSVFEVQVQW